MLKKFFLPIVITIISVAETDLTQIYSLTQPSGEFYYKFTKPKDNRKSLTVSSKEIEAAISKLSFQKGENVDEKIKNLFNNLSQRANITLECIEPFVNNVTALKEVDIRCFSSNDYHSIPLILVSTNIQDIKTIIDRKSKIILENYPVIPIFKEGVKPQFKIILGNDKPILISENKPLKPNEEKEVIMKYVSFVIKNGSNRLNFPMGAMPPMMAHGQDAKDITKYITDGMKGEQPPAFAACMSCHGPDGKGMDGMSSNINDMKTLLEHAKH